MGGEIDSIIDFDFRVGLEGSQRNGRPFCMHLSYSLLHLKSYFDLLIPRKFDNRDTYLFLLVSAGEILHWLNSPHFLVFPLQSIEYASDVERGDLHDFFACVLGLEDEVGLAEEAVFNTLLGAGALPRVFEFFNGVADEGDESDSLAEELVVED